MKTTHPRILQIANRAGPLYLFMPPLSRALEERGAEVEYACMRGESLWEPLVASGVKLHELSAGSWTNPLTWTRLHREIRALAKDRRYDMMIVHTPAMSWVARLAVNRIVPATLYFSHGLPFAPEQSRFAHVLFRGIERWAGKYTDALSVMNRDDAAAAEDGRLVRPDGEWGYVPGVGVDVAAYSKQPSPEEIAEVEQMFGLRPGHPMLLYLGRFIPTKRPGDMVELAKRLGPDVDIVMAGEGPLWKGVHKAAAEVGPHVRVISFTDKVPVLLARCSMLVHPSVFREGLPRILLEAHAAYKPVVTYDVRGSRDVIVDGVTGYLPRPCDVEGLTSGVRRILEDDALRERMGRAGHDRVSTEFSIEASLAAILPLIRSVLRRKGICELPE